MRSTRLAAAAFCLLAAFPAIAAAARPNIVVIVTDDQSPLTLKAWAMIGWIGGAFGLFLVTVVRYWRLVGRTMRRSFSCTLQTPCISEKQSGHAT